MKKNVNEKTELKLQKKYTQSDNWNTYDPIDWFEPGRICALKNEMQKMIAIVAIHWKWKMERMNTLKMNIEVNETQRNEKVHWNMKTRK